MATQQQIQNVKNRGNFGWEKSVESTFDLDYGIFRGFYVEADGNVAVTYLDDSTDTFVGVKGGQVYSCWAKKINTSGTTLTAAQVHVLDPATTS